MNNDESKSLDVLGIRPAVRAIDRTTEASIAGASAFLSRICLPAAEEFGLLLKDRVSHWRARNAARIAEEAEKLVTERGACGEAHPRLVWEILDKGSWTEDDVAQKMWAGLLASSCSAGKDDSNILFTAILAQLTSVQIRILKHVCEIAPKYAAQSGLPFAEEMTMSLADLIEVTGIDDLHRLDRELDHLRALELVHGGFPLEELSTVSTEASLQVLALGMHLYIRGNGFFGSPVEFWDLKEKEKKTSNKAQEPKVSSLAGPS